MMVWRHSTCRQQTGGCRHRSCSSCRIYEGESSPSVLSLSQGHLTLGQTPSNNNCMCKSTRKQSVVFIYSCRICMDKSSNYILSLSQEHLTIGQTPSVATTKRHHSASKYERRHEKTYLLGFRPSPTQTRLYNHRRWLETSDLESLFVLMLYIHGKQLVMLGQSVT